jgi:hypothetical protein
LVERGVETCLETDLSDYADLATFMVAGFVCVYLAGRMALRRGRSPKPWMYLAASFGVAPLAILALLPKRQG